MADPGSRHLIAEADAQRARELLDAWLADYLAHVGHPLPNPGELLSLRGLITAALADARAAGHAEGYETCYEDLERNGALR